MVTMKNIFLAIFFIASTLSVQAQENSTSNDGPKMEFESSVLDYGLIEHKSDIKS